MTTFPLHIGGLRVDATVCGDGTPTLDLLTNRFGASLTKTQARELACTLWAWAGFGDGNAYGNVPVYGHEPGN